MSKTRGNENTTTRSPTTVIPSGNEVVTTPGVTSEVNPDQTNNFKGKYLETVLPNGWKLEEYENGQGTDSLLGEVSYRGLTGFAIFNENNAKVFATKAVMGVGGIGCGEIFKF